MKIILATQNEGKVVELREALPSSFQIVGLPPELANVDIPEDGTTLEENALQKARFVFERTRILTIADDTGLEVSALDGRPGVYSARYAGPAKNAAANMDKLLLELEGQQDRSAQFRTVLAVVDSNLEQTFEGKAMGDICTHRVGEGGFGYDPVFQPAGYRITFAEMSTAEKGAISHRGRAIKKMVAYFS